MDLEVIGTKKYNYFDYIAYNNYDISHEPKRRNTVGGLEARAH